MIKVTKTEYGTVYAITGRPGSGGTSSANPIQKKEWVGLTDKEMFDCLVQTDYAAVRLPLGLKLFAEFIEAKLKEKNNGNG
jgi:hypothetical protein